MVYPTIMSETQLSLVCTNRIDQSELNPMRIASVLHRDLDGRMAHASARNEEMEIRIGHQHLLRGPPTQVGSLRHDSLLSVLEAALLIVTSDE